MVTQMIQAMTFDVLTIVSGNDFFNQTASARKKELKKQWKNYPEPVVAYLTDVKEERFVSDMEGLLPILAETSVIAQAKRLGKEENAYFIAILASLSECRKLEGEETRLAAQISWFKKASSMYARVFDRELQLLLLEASGEDSPIAQIATELEVDLSGLAGVPSVQVQRSLLGGSRVFHNGKLIDHSWRARLTRILSAVS